MQGGLRRTDRGELSVTADSLQVGFLLDRAFALVVEQLQRPVSMYSSADCVRLPVS